MEASGNPREDKGYWNPASPPKEDTRSKFLISAFTLKLQNKTWFKVATDMKAASVE